MTDTVLVVCPYCQEEVELYVDPDTEGSFVEDCAVCCRPWSVGVTRGEDGTMSAWVERAQ